MKRAELKKLLKPMVKECIKESLLEEGVLSSIISEVMRGVGTPMIQEKPVKAEPMFKADVVSKKSNINEGRKKLLDAIGAGAYGGVDLFEGTTPDIPRQRSAESPASSPLGDIDPTDPGVDIAGIVALGGKNWGAFLK